MRRVNGHTDESTSEVSHTYWERAATAFRYFKGLISVFFDLELSLSLLTENTFGGKTSPNAFPRSALRPRLKRVQWLGQSPRPKDEGIRDKGIMWQDAVLAVEERNVVDKR